jgi:hypothetical protein
MILFRRATFSLNMNYGYALESGLGYSVIKWGLTFAIVVLSMYAYGQPTHYDFTQSIHNADITISPAPTSNGSFSAFGVFTPNASADIANVNVTALIAYLNVGTSVTINTANISGAGGGNINLTSAITWTGISPAVGLNLNVFNDININAATTTTTGSYVFNADDNVNIGGAMTITTGSMSFLQAIMLI